MRSRWVWGLVWVVLGGCAGGSGTSGVQSGTGTSGGAESGAAAGVVPVLPPVATVPQGNTAPTTEPVVTIPVAPDGTKSGGSGDGVVLDAEESAFVGLLNAYRVQNGLSVLQVSSSLTDASRWMSTDMATKNYFSHTDSLGRDSFARMPAFGYAGKGYSGENIAAGHASAQDTLDQWKNSPAHNANMLGARYKVIGVGRAYSATSSYRWYWTTDFAQ